jgi:hypothetical protein
MQNYFNILKYIERDKSSTRITGDN